MKQTCSIHGCEIPTTQSYKDYLPAAFQQIISTEPGQLVDVRTPEEFASDRLHGASNIDFYAADFDTQLLQSLNKSQPVYLYCKSGRRSGLAAQMLIDAGFADVYNLQGGILLWDMQDFPIQQLKPSTGGLSEQEFRSALLKTPKTLVNFYAHWCPPCKEMGPIWEKLSASMASAANFIRINVDENKALVKALKLENLPMVLLYKNSEEAARKEGFVDEKGLMEMASF